MFTGCGAIKTAPASAGVPFDPRRFLKFIEFDTSTETMILKKFKEAELITHNDYMPIISASSDIRF